MKSSELQKVLDIFPDCTFEGHEGLWIYDKKGQMICAYLNNGFSLNLEYEHINKVKERLEANGFEAWWHQIMEEAEFQEIMDNAKR